MLTQTGLGTYFVKFSSKIKYRGYIKACRKYKKKNREKFLKNFHDFFFKLRKFEWKCIKDLENQEN